jgi:hypothetical protein
MVGLSVSAKAIWRTLVFHVVFFAALGGTELLAPSAACVDGLAGPLSTAGVPVVDMCSALLSNPAGNLVLFGLAKYHLLFGVISAVAACLGLGLTVQRAVLVLHAANFASDVTWAALHLAWIGAGPLALMPQILLVLWNLHCGCSPLAATSAAAAGDSSPGRLR